MIVGVVVVVVVIVAVVAVGLGTAGGGQEDVVMMECFKTNDDFDWSPEDEGM